MSARLAWDLKRYDVMTPKKEKKRVLHGQCNAVFGGEMFLILGPSGSGKTSLLTILAGRNVGGSWNGTLVADGSVCGRGPRQSTGFVDQQPLFFSTLTVRESLSYTGRLRLPTAGVGGVKRVVDRVLGELNLGRCADTYCGDERLKGISGGEKKRLQIAAELVSDPKSLLLDEPTSGLDAATALLTCKVLSKICRTASPSKAVVAVVHQPRASLLTLFDTMLVLSEGRPAYGGGCGDELVRHFAALGLSPPDHENPADFVLDAINARDGVARGCFAAPCHRRSRLGHR